MTDFDWNNDPMMATPGAPMDFTFNVGDLLILEMGEYSNSSFTDPVRVVKRFSKQEIAELFRAAHPSTKSKYGFSIYADPDDFLPWLVKEGYVEDVPKVRRWHIGSYGDFEP